MGPLIGAATSAGTTSSTTKAKVESPVETSVATDKSEESAPLSSRQRTNASSDGNVQKEESVEREERAAVVRGKVITACAMYSSCSVGMVLVNKSLASSYNYLIDGNLNVLLVVFQAVIAVICVSFCKQMKWVEYPSFNSRTALQWCPVNILFCLMLFTGMASLQHNNVPIVTVFKNITNIFTSAGDWYFFGTKISILIMLSFAIMLGGAIAAAEVDIHITFTGLFWMLANCFSTSGYVLYLKFATQTVDLTKFGMVFYNNLLCTLILLPVASAMGQLRLFYNTPKIHTWAYFIKNVLAGFVGFFLNFASLNCVAQTGPTTYAIIGSLNKIPISIFGWLLFDADITPRTWLFIVVSFLGGFLYSYAKIRESQLKLRHQQRAT